MKKLLIILPQLAIGGAENMVYELAKNIDKSIYQVQIICYMGKLHNGLEEKTEKIAQVVYLDCKGKITPKNIIKVLKAISAFNPDVIHSHMGGTLFASLWSFLHRKAMVVTVHTTPEKAFSKSIEKVLRFRLKFKKSVMVAVSENNKMRAQKYFNLTDKCVFVNNGIDTGKFFHKEHKYFTYINVARLDNNKNQVMIVRAFYEICKTDGDVRLVLLGDGPDRQLLTDNISQLGLTDKVIMPGNVPDTENYYSGADCFVLASFREAMPMSVLEAMAAGLPVVSTDVGGLKDVVKDNGILIQAGDETLLTKAMLEIKNADKAKYEYMSLQSEKIVQDYSSVKMAAKYMDIYNQLLG